MEMKAYQAYRKPDLPLAFWRTSTGREVDFILPEIEIVPWWDFIRRLWDGEFC